MSVLLWKKGKIQKQKNKNRVSTMALTLAGLAPSLVPLTGNSARPPLAGGHGSPASLVPLTGEPSSFVPWPLCGQGNSALAENHVPTRDSVFLTEKSRTKWPG